jgi:phosphoribosylformylglycinamidine cyclo-ligase
LIQRTAKELGGVITNEEMFKTFNMGWGFAVIVDRACAERAVDVLGKASAQAEQIGHVTDSPGVKVLHKGKKIVLR